MPEPAGTDWTIFEIEAIVADYLHMLQIELSGGKVVKVEHNRTLQQLIGRSKGSIEYKHQNISAVMAALGLPFIDGYKPALNYQHALFKVIEAQLVEQKLHDSLAITSTTSAVSPSGLIYEPAPLLSEPQTDDPVIRRIVRKFNPAERDARARKLGTAGEAFLFEAEKMRLSTGGRDDLAAKVRWVARDDGDGAGYDILSFSKLGEKRLLEVKTTNGPATTPFWISENERRVSEEKSDLFRIVRLYNFSQKTAAYQLKPPLTDHVRLIPTQYRATFR